jgi:hypothetical protein
VHDPLTVIFDVLRPWPQKNPNGKRWSEQKRSPQPRLYRHRQWGPLNCRAARFTCAHCDDGKVRDPVPSYQVRHVYGPGDECPDCLGRGFTPCPRRRRLYFSWHFWLFGRRRYYFPPLVTVWHVDPDKGGDDDSCRRAVRTRQLTAHHDEDKLADWWWWLVFRKMHWWHLHHWSVQVIPWGRLQRWRKERCPACGERFGWSESGIAPGFDMPAYHFKCAETRGFGMQAAEKEPVA